MTAMHSATEMERLLAHEASEWLDNVRSGAARFDALDAWLAQSQLHTDAFLKILAVDIELDRAGEAARLDPQRRVDAAVLMSMIDSRVVPFTRGRASGTVAPSRPQRRMRVFAAIAAGLAVVAVALVVAGHYRQAPQTRVETAVGEQRTVTLSDATRVTLNESSHVRVLYSATSREIELRGEGIFKVAKDSARPFIVKTPLAQVRAVGTEFNVHERGTSSAVVTVLEGRVQVVPLGSAGSSQVAQYLDAGEVLEIHATGRLERRADADVARTVAWQARRLPFEGATLEELVREFNRYSAVKFRIDGPVPSTRFGGIFDATDAHSLADYLSREPELLVEQRGDQFVIRARPKAGE
jgi:transmembrane sensor